MFAGIVTLQRSDRAIFFGATDRLGEEDKAFIREIVEQRNAEAGGDGSVEGKLRFLGQHVYAYARDSSRYPNSFDRRYGKHLFSWRVSILPFIGGQSLYELFDHNEPWDSEHNRQLIPYMPNLFQSPGTDAQEGKTRFLAVSGKGTLFEEPKGVEFKDVPDGASKTITLVEVPESMAVEWTKPQEWEYSEPEDIARLKGSRDNGFFAVFADGTPLFISDENDVQDISPAFTRGDGLTARVK